MNTNTAVPAGPRPMLRPELAGARTYRVFNGAQSHFELPYAAIPGFRPLVLDLHIPDRGDGQPIPVVVYAHGGGFFTGSRTTGPWAFLLKAGYAVASVDYRLNGECAFPGPVQDVAAAIRWVRAHAAEHGLDGDQIVGFGSSAGGYLMNAVALAADQPGIVGDLGPTPELSCRLTAVIDHYAPVDFASLSADAENAAQPGRTPDNLTKFLGFDPSARPADAERANLCRYATAASPPFLIAHGDADRIVGISQSRRLHEALKTAGARAELVVVPGADHGSPEFDQPPLHERALAFLKPVIEADSVADRLADTAR